MTRKIKFRAYVKPRNWDNLGGKIYKVLDMSWQGWEPDELVLFDPRDGEKNFSVDKEEYILMQYTGLKDKNGVEIYEGDILSYTDFDTSPTSGDGDEYENKGIIEYSEEYAMYTVTNANEVKPDEIWDQFDLEVLGNIYENPELLEAESAE